MHAVGSHVGAGGAGVTGGDVGGGATGGGSSAVLASSGSDASVVGGAEGGVVEVGAVVATGGVVEVGAVVATGGVGSTGAGVAGAAVGTSLTGVVGAGDGFAGVGAVVATGAVGASASSAAVEVASSLADTTPASIASLALASNISPGTREPMSAPFAATTGALASRPFVTGSVGADALRRPSAKFSSTPCAHAAAVTTSAAASPHAMPRADDGSDPVTRSGRCRAGIVGPTRTAKRTPIEENGENRDSGSYESATQAKIMAEDAQAPALRSRMAALVAIGRRGTSGILRRFALRAASAASL